jgi:hypothetical protein
MPLTLTLSEGVLPKGTEKQAYARLSDAMLKWHGLSGNKVMTPMVIGHINVIDKEHTFSGSKEASVAFVEWKVPSFAFTDRKAQLGYVEEATNIIHEMSGGKQPKDRIWVNVLHAVDGTWGVNGAAMTNTELKEAVSKG